MGVRENHDHIWLSEAVRAAHRRPPLRWWRRVTDWLAVELLRRATGLQGAAVFLGVGAMLTMVALVLPSSGIFPEPAAASTYLLTLWQVLAALVGLTLVILVLLVETVQRSSQGEHLWHRFVEVSGLRVILPAVMVSVLIVGGHALLLLPNSSIAVGPPGLPNLLPLSFLLTAVTALGIVWLYDRMFRFLNPAYVQELAGAYLLDTIRRQLTEAIMRNLGGHLLGPICESIGLEFRPFMGQRSGMQGVRLSETGQIVDIDLRELRKLASLVHSDTPPRAALVATVHDIVRAGHDVCLLVKADALNVDVERQARRCFKIVPWDENDSLDEPFNFLVEQAFGAIEAGRLRQLGDAMRALLEAVSIAVRSIHEYGIAFDADSATSDALMGWRPLVRPFREYDRILEASLVARDATLVLEVIRWPARVMEFALNEGDHFSYQEAARHLAYLYQVSRGDHASRIDALLRDRSRRYLREIAEIEIASRLRRAGNSAVIIQLEQFGRALLTSFASTLKMAIDARDIDYFREALRDIGHVLDEELLSSDLGLPFSALNDPGRQPRSLDSYSLSPMDRSRLEFLLHMSRWRDALLLSLGAWLCRQIYDEATDQTFATDAFRLLRVHFEDFHRLWRAFHDALGQAHNRLPLSDWELWDGPELEARSLNTGDDLARYFTVVGLRCVPLDMAERAYTLVETPQATWAAQLVEQQLVDIQTKTTRWSEYLDGQDASERAKVLANVLQAAVEDERQRERRRIRAAALSAERIAEFTQGVHTAWQRGAWLRSLFESASNVKTVTARSGNDRTQFGFWHLVSKDPFVAESNVIGIEGLGEDYGAGLARGENERIYGALRHSAKRHRLGAKSVPARLAQLIQFMDGDGRTADAIILRGQFRAIELLETSSDYKSKWETVDVCPSSAEGLFKG